MSPSDEDIFSFIVIGSLIMGLILVITGSLFIGSLGFLGIKTQQTIFGDFDSIIGLIQGLIRVLVVPIYIFVVGLIGLFILYKTDWPEEVKETNE